MGLLDDLMRSIRRQPASTGAWLRDHLARIAPPDGTPAPGGDELRKLLDELDSWALELYNNPQDPNLWRDMIKEWRRVSSPEAAAAVLRRFGDEEWIHDEVDVRFRRSNGQRGLGLGHLHDAFVKAGLIDGPTLIVLEIWKHNSSNGDGS